MDRPLPTPAAFRTTTTMRKGNGWSIDVGRWRLVLVSIRPRLRLPLEAMTMFGKVVMWRRNISIAYRGRMRMRWKMRGCRLPWGGLYIDQAVLYIDIERCRCFCCLCMAFCIFLATRLIGRVVFSCHILYRSAPSHNFFDLNLLSLTSMVVLSLLPTIQILVIDAVRIW